MKSLKMVVTPGMTVGELHSRLGELILENKAQYTVDVLTESKKNGQCQQNLGSVAVSEKQNLVILVPKGF